MKTLISENKGTIPLALVAVLTAGIVMASIAIASYDLKTAPTGNGNVTKSKCGNVGIEVAPAKEGCAWVLEYDSNGCIISQREECPNLGQAPPSEKKGFFASILRRLGGAQ